VEGDACATPSPETQIGRREFLARAVALGLSLPVAATVAKRAGVGIRVSERGRPFEGVKLSFAKAPHGENEQELFNCQRKALYRSGSGGNAKSRASCSEALRTPYSGSMRRVAQIGNSTGRLGEPDRAERLRKQGELAPRC
jgi:hypothetical protein